MRSTTGKGSVWLWTPAAASTPTMGEAYCGVLRRGAHFPVARCLGFDCGVGDEHLLRIITANLAEELVDESLAGRAEEREIRLGEAIGHRDVYVAAHWLVDDLEVLGRVAGGDLGMRASTSASHACGSTSLRRQVWINE